MSVEDAEDAVQSFFAGLINSGSLGKADPERGKLRTFLLSAFRFFLADEHDRRMTWRRGGRTQTVPFESLEAEERFAAEPADTQTPEVIFERRWALSLLETGLDKLAAEREANGQGKGWQILRPFLDASQKEILSYDAVAAQLGSTANNVRVIVYRLRRRYREVMRELIAATLANESPEAVDDELRQLLACLQ
jgi:RNA polymerase sigma-70 factor (ECF subfamily)